MTTRQPDFTERLLHEAGIRPNMRVLDVGCGTGDVTFLAARLVGKGGEVVGVDRSEHALAIARQRTGGERDCQPCFVNADLLDLPETVDDFDAIIGRRVLMYQADTILALRALTMRLKPGGIVVFQEHDTTMVPASLSPFPVHAQAQAWLQRMIALEGADLHIGFNFHRILTGAGLLFENIRAECIVQTPSSAHDLAGIIRACLPRILALGVATEEQVDIDSLSERLTAERTQSDDIYIGDVMFGAWGRKPLHPR